MDWRMGSCARGTEGGVWLLGRGMREVELRSVLPPAAPPRVLGGVRMFGSGELASGGKASPARLLRADIVGLMSSSYTEPLGAQNWEHTEPARGVGATCV